MSSPASAELPAHPRPWDEKNPFISGILAVLIPGAGHFYQGRMLKGVIYSVSILGLFIWGQKLGEGMVVYNLPDKGGAFRHVSLSYAAQLGTGIIAAPALIQNKRAERPSNQSVTVLDQPLTAEFVGRLTPSEQADTGRLTGTVRLEPVQGPYGPEMKGKFSGQLDGQPVEFNLGGRFRLDKAIKAGFRRRLECGVADGEQGANLTGRVIDGSIPRSLIDSYGSPPDTDQLDDVQKRLGKLYELALVFTWIAGLLNVLAIWDCIYGPAYGFGDEYLEAPGSDEPASPSGANAASRPATSVSEPPRPEGVPPTPPST